MLPQPRSTPIKRIDQLLNDPDDDVLAASKLLYEISRSGLSISMRCRTPLKPLASRSANVSVSAED